MASDQDIAELVAKAEQLEEQEEDGRTRRISGQQSKYKVAKAWEEAAKAAHRHLGKYDDTTMTIRDRWAVSLREAGEYEKAIVCNKENVERYMKTHGFENELTLESRRRLAENCMRIKSYDEAIKNYKAVVDATGSPTLDASTVEAVCQDRSDYAAALFESGEVRNIHLAVDVNMQSLTLAKQFLGTDHLETLKIRYDLGVEFLKLSKPDDAAAELEKCIKILTNTKCKIRNHPEYNKLLFDVHTTWKKTKPQLALDDSKQKSKRQEAKTADNELETKGKKVQGRLDALDLAGSKLQTKKTADVNDRRSENVYLEWEKAKLRQSAKIRQPEASQSMQEKQSDNKAALLEALMANTQSHHRGENDRTVTSKVEENQDSDTRSPIEKSRNRRGHLNRELAENTQQLNSSPPRTKDIASTDQLRNAGTAQNMETQFRLASRLNKYRHQSANRVVSPQISQSQRDKGSVEHAQVDKKLTKSTKEAGEQLGTSGSSSRHSPQPSTPVIEVSPAISKSRLRDSVQDPKAFSPTTDVANDTRMRVAKFRPSSGDASQSDMGTGNRARSESAKRNRHSVGALDTALNPAKIYEGSPPGMPGALIAPAPKVDIPVQRRHSHSDTRSQTSSTKKPEEAVSKQLHKVKLVANVQSVPGNLAEATLNEPFDPMIWPETPMAGTARHSVPGGWQQDFDEPSSKPELRRVSSNTELLVPQTGAANGNTKRTRSSSHEPPRVRSAPLNPRASMTFFSHEAVSRADEWFEDLERETHEGFLDAYRNDIFMEKSARTVKIAILDTGISKRGSLLQIPDAIRRASRRIKFGKLVDPDLPPNEDTNGHGTHAAGLILRVCPYADLYVYRVSKDGKNISKKNVTEALNDAVEKKKVDIVSMSLGWSEDSDEELRAAIDRAKTNKVLMFAASSNEGVRRRMAYPARADEVIAVDAADGFGSPSKFNPPPGHKERFTALGEAVNSAFPITLCDNDEEPQGWRRMSGTSCATPIAAAIAGLILEFSRQQPLCHDPSVENHLKRVDGMREVFRELFSTRTSSFNYLDPMKLFRFNESCADGGRWLDINSPRYFAAMRIVQCLQPFGGYIGTLMSEAVRNALANGQQG